jgi:ATP-dependent Clp protease ATP-binding subunit ClpC
MFERFTDRARRVVVQARIEARSLRHTYIGTEHLLLGLISEDQGLGVRVLRTLGVDPEVLAGEITVLVGRGEHPVAEAAHIPFTPSAKKTLELALREALDQKHNYIGTEHLLLGLLRQGDGPAAEVLAVHGIDVDMARSQVKRLLGGRTPSRVVRLTGGVGTPSQAATLTEMTFQLRSINRRISAIEAKLGIEKSPADERLNRIDQTWLAEEAGAETGDTQDTDPG